MNDWGLFMARLTPLVHQGMLTTYLLDGTKQTVKLDDETWQRWLKECDECCFHFRSPLGDFAVRCNKGKYWSACRMHKRQRYKLYLGKTELVTLPALYRMAEKLYEDIFGEPPPADLLALSHDELTLYQQHAALDAEALSTPERPSTPPPLPFHDPDTLLDRNKESKPLTPRERQVLAALASAPTNEQIALSLDMSINTVKLHLRHLYQKLAFSSRAALIVYAKHHAERMMVAAKTFLAFETKWNEL